MILSFPAPGCPAGQCQPVSGNRKPYLLSHCLAAKDRGDFCADKVREDRRSQPGGVGIDEEKQGLPGQKL